MSAPVQPTVKDRLLTAFRALVRAEFPQYNYFGIYEYSVTAVNANPLALLVTLATSVVSIDATPVDTTIPLPSISNLIIKAIVKTKPTVGDICHIMFANGDPSKPICVSCDSNDELQLTTDGQSPTEHVMTLEATVLLLYNFFYAMSLVAPAPAGMGILIQPLITPAILAAMAASSVPAPPLLAAQLILAASTSAGMVSGTVPSNTIGPLAAGVSALSTKLNDVSGLFPGIGCAKVKGA